MTEQDRSSGQSTATQTAAQPDSQGGAQQQTNQPRQQPQQQAQGAGAGETTAQSAKAVSWFTETFLRAAIAIIGVVLLLVALGQMAGVDTFSIIGSVLGTEIAQWGAVAVFAILLVVAASKSWSFVGQ